MAVCPNCQGETLARKYAAFWAPVDAEGADLAVNFTDHECSTELTDEWRCADCEHEWTE